MKPNVITRADLLLTIELLKLVARHAEPPNNVKAEELIRLYGAMAGIE